MLLKRIWPERVDFCGSLTPREVDELAVDPVVRVLQTSSPVELETWELLNDSLFARRADITLRVYGFYSSICDLSFLNRMHNVRRFSADSLLRAKHIESVASLPNLQELAIGIYELEDFNFLDDMRPDGLIELSLLATRSKKPRLVSLPRFTQLHSLRLAGQQKDISVISHLPALEKLTLRSITVPEMTFLRGLKHLWFLNIGLGGTNNLMALDGLAGIKHLALCQIREFHNLGVVSTLHGLQLLALQSLPHIAAIPDLASLNVLRRVCLENLKGLRDISGLAKAPALEELYHIDARGMEPTHYLELLNHKRLRSLRVGFGSAKKNKILRDLAAQAGIGEYPPSEFAFT